VLGCHGSGEGGGLCRRLFCSWKPLPSRTWFVSHLHVGVSAATSKVCAERKGRDVYVVGAANVGKSAFVRAMLKVCAPAWAGQDCAWASKGRGAAPMQALVCASK